MVKFVFIFTCLNVSEPHVASCSRGAWRCFRVTKWRVIEFVDPYLHWIFRPSSYAHKELYFFVNNAHAETVKYFVNKYLFINTVFVTLKHFSMYNA